MLPHVKVGQRHQEKPCLGKNETADRAGDVICQNPFDFGVVKAAKGGRQTGFSSAYV